MSIHLSKLAKQGYNRVALTRTVFSDFETPLSVYLKLTMNKAYTYLFESVENGKQWGRFSIIGLPSRHVIKIYGNRWIEEIEGKKIKDDSVPDPIQAIEQWTKKYHVYSQLSIDRFCGGLVGYFAYDTVRFFEKKLEKSTPKDLLNVPDITLMVSDDFIIFDNFRQKMEFVSLIDPKIPDAEDKINEKFDNWSAQLSSLSSAAIQSALKQETVQMPSEFSYSLNQAEFMKGVEKIKAYTQSGDVMQTVLSTRISCPFIGNPINLYRALRVLNPSPYMYYMNFEEYDIVGSSPEILVRLDQDEVTLRPLAGTRKRGKTEAEDIALAEELQKDPKECAEHLMLIDLGRNDVGRVSEPGSVLVTEKMVIERYSHVMHLSSNIIGKKQFNLSALDVLASALPAGTLSGAPKVKAMQILDELEPVKRSIYGGAVGYLSWNGRMDTAIALRTAVIKDGYLHNQVGAGIVNDSDPESEWQEIISKSQAVHQAIYLASQGF